MQLKLESVIHAITLLTFSVILIFVKQLGEELWFTVGGQHISFGASPQVLKLDMEFASCCYCSNLLYCFATTIFVHLLLYSSV